MKLVGILALMLWALGAGGCTATQPPTQNDFRADATGYGLLSNTGQNVQVWPDESFQAGATQLDSGLITPDSTNWMSSSISGIIAITKNGVQVKNPGNLDADEVFIEFGDPIMVTTQTPFALENGEVVILESGDIIVPIVSVTLKGLRNEVTTVVQANTEQVALWTGILSEISEDQRDTVLAGLERDKVIASETAGLIRAALEAASPTP